MYYVIISELHVPHCHLTKLPVKDMYMSMYMCLPNQSAALIKHAKNHKQKTKHLYEWVPGILYEWVPGILYEWVPGILYEWVPGILYEWVPGILYEWVPGILYEWVPGILYEWVPGILYEWVPGILYEWVQLLGLYTILCTVYLQHSCIYYHSL